MHYVIFLGIFGLPFVAGVGMIAARVLDAFAPEEPPKPGRVPQDDLQATESHVSELVDTFFAPPIEQKSKK
jgi:hypothetical protein